MGLLGVVILAAPVFAQSPTISTRFFNSVDIAGFDSCAWGEGQPAANREVEAVIRDQVESLLEARGFEVVAAPADCRVTSRAIREGNFPIGMLVIEVHEQKTGTLAWRGEATGLINFKPKQAKKKVRKIVKTMLKNFPKRR